MTSIDNHGTMDLPNISSNECEKTIASSRSLDEAWDYWKNHVTPEPISNELREMIRLDLRKKWYATRLQNFRFWTYTNWTRVDTEKILLDSKVGNHDNDVVSPRHATWFWGATIRVRPGSIGVRLIKLPIY